MNEIRKEVLNEKDEVIEAYKEQCSMFRAELRNLSEINTKSSDKLFWVTIGSLLALIVISTIMAMSNFKLQSSFINFMNQYEYTTEYMTETYEITQDNTNGDNSNYIGNGGNVK